MIKKLKLAIKCFTLIIIIFLMYIGVEYYRFNTKLGCSPLFQIKLIKSNVSNDIIKEKHIGLLLSFEYETTITQESNDLISVKAYKGQMLLFNKICLQKWKGNEIT